MTMTGLTTEQDQLSTRKSGQRGSLRRRFIRHHLPIALLSSAVLLACMYLPFLDTRPYPPPSDIFAEGIIGAIPDGPYPARPETPTGHAERMAVLGPDEASPAQGTAQEPGAAQDQHSQHSGGATAPAEQEDESAAAPAHGPSTNDADTATASAGGDGSADDSGSPPSRPETILFLRRLSFATGYAALGLLAITLLIGPANLLLRRRIPVSSYFRRDVGLWTAVASVAHVIFSLLIGHADGTILGYFFAPDDRSRVLTNSFGLANWAGLAAVIIVGLLAVISSDAALRKLRARRWKKIQRWNYVLFALVILHALLYGALWRETSPYTIVLAVCFIIVIVGQAVGVRLWRRRNARPPAAAPV